MCSRLGLRRGHWTGTCCSSSSAITYLSAGSLPLVVVVIVLATGILTNITTNAAAASILTPVAIGIAAEISVSPVLMLALVATCISFTFINPFSHQSNLMVMRPGGYSNASFVRFGVPLYIAASITAIVVGYLLLR